jgi:aconitate hydratase
MRARAGDPPCTMTQKILAGRAEDPSLSSDLLRVKIDQVVLSREPERALSEALLAGSRKFAV